jgi:hypothetical protein
MAEDRFMQAAFNKVCDKAMEKGDKRFFVSLYESIPFYGGPEEGGWWGSDCKLIASKEYQCEEDAQVAIDAVREMAQKLTEQSKRADDQACLDSMEWLEARGLDADYLPEPDGGSSFWVTIENNRGENTSQGSRCYE